VFDGRGGPYDEEAETTATDLYGRSKALGEPTNALVIRTSIIGPELQHLYSLLAWFLAQSGSCQGYINHHWNGMSTLQLSRVIDQIMQSNLYCHGVRHIFSNDVSKYELLCLMREAYQRDIAIMPYEDTLAKDSRLRTVYPDFIGRLAILDLHSQLAELPAVSDALGRWRSAVLMQSQTGQVL
jgi:dTDP-4-dehydrorhamnose reductase